MIWDSCVPPIPLSGEIAGAEWPDFGWLDDIRAPLFAAMAVGQPAALATLYQVVGSAPRGEGAQMLFVPSHDGGLSAHGYFSGDCIEGDVASHAAEVLADGKPQRLHYGAGSPWIDLRLRCGGALHVLVECVRPNAPEARALQRQTDERKPCIWHTDGANRTLVHGDGPVLGYDDAPFYVRRRYDPPRRLIVSGGDPGALALAQLGTMAQFETILIRPNGPQSPPPFPISRYLREEPAAVLARLRVDRWTAYVGATHEDHHDLDGCFAALRGGAGYVGMIGAKSRTLARIEALEARGATPDEVARLHLSPGMPGLGKSPWEVATGIVAQVMQALNPAHERI